MRKSSKPSPRTSDVRYVSVMGMIDDLAKTCPDDVAIVFQERSIKYKHLDFLTTKIASGIKIAFKNHTGRDLTNKACVGLYVSRGIEMILGMLAILKSGATYVPLDTSNTSERLEYIIQDAGLQMIVTDRNAAHKTTGRGLVKLIIEDVLESPENNSISLLNEISPHSLAYIIYTSGSTGRPKGVMIEHGSLVHVISAHGRIFFSKGDRALQFLSPGFDASISEILTPLTVGATLYVIPEDVQKNIEATYNFLLQQEISVAVFPASILGRLPQNP